MRRFALVAAWLGLLSLQLVVASSYVDRGAWWHWLLHVPVGLGVGLAVGALASLWRPVPALACALVGQVVSIVPDLMFRFMRMPHDASMDLYLGHIAIHTGPSPVLVALGVLLLGGWGWLAVALGRRRVGAVLAVAAGVLLLVACLSARTLPTHLSDYARFAVGP